MSLRKRDGGIGFIALALTLSGSLPLAQTASKSPVPLVKGLMIVTAVSDPYGDYESIKTIDLVDAAGVHIAFSSQTPTGKDASGRPIVRNIAVKRTVRREDLQRAHEYMQTFSSAGPETYPNTTAVGASAAVLTDLRTKGETTFTFQTPGRQPSMDKVLGALGGKGSLDDLAKTLDATKASGTLKRVGPGAKFSVLVNDRRVELPAIHAKGDFDGVSGDFFFLDDSENPLVLSFDTGKVQGRLQVVKLSFASAQASPQIEQELSQDGRAELHGIYFDFGSATIRPESDPVLNEIADVLAKNPKWNLSVEGHTDNVGSDAANLELSRRRAEAVRDALVTRYDVSAARLATGGFGASQPKEPNTTLEGRARNRRVELARK